MSIFTEPNQGGNPVLSPIVQKAIDLMNKKKAQQPIVAAPDNFEKAYSGYMQEQNQPITPNTPNTPTGEFSNVVTDNPDQTFRSPEGQSYVPFRNVQVRDTRMPMNPTTQPQQPIVDTKPKAVNPMPTKEQFIAMTPEQRVKIQQELMDAGYNMKPSIKEDGKLDGTWGKNTAAALKWYEDNLKNGKLPTQGQPSTQTSSSSSSSSSTTTEEKTYPTFDEYVAASGLNPVNQIIESIKPVRKEADEERLKKIAAANAIGDGLRLIGDAAYGDKGSIGANIPKRDNKYTFKAIEDMRALKDKYDKESKDYGMLKLQQLQNMRREWLSDKTRKESAQASKEAAATKMLFEADQNKKKMDNAMAIAKLKGGYAQRIASLRGGGGKNKNPTVVTKKGNEIIKIDESQYYQILANVLNEKKNSLGGKTDAENELLASQLIKDPNSIMASKLVQDNWEIYYKPNKDYSGIEPRTDVKPIKNQKYFTFDDIINKEKQRIPLETQQTVVKNITSDPNLSREQKAQAIYNMVLEAGVNGEDVSEDEAYNIAMSLLND